MKLSIDIVYVGGRRAKEFAEQIARDLRYPGAVRQNQPASATTSCLNYHVSVRLSCLFDDGKRYDVERILSPDLISQLNDIGGYLDYLRRSLVRELVSGAIEPYLRSQLGW